MYTYSNKYDLDWENKRPGSGMLVVHCKYRVFSNRVNSTQMQV
jgi:hypothetical protein